VSEKETLRSAAERSVKCRYSWIVAGLVVALFSAYLLRHSANEEPQHQSKPAVEFLPDLLPNSVNEERFERIEIGMTEKDVEEILGGRAGAYFQGKITVTCPRGRHNSPVCLTFEKPDDDIICTTAILNGEILWQRKGWISARLGIWVWFDQDNKVLSKKSYSAWRS
jgi:hypothetical protein